MKKFLILALLSLYCLNSYGQQKSGEQLIKSDTLSLKKVQLLALPILFYTPETQLAFGAGAEIFLLRKKNRYNSRISSIMFGLIFTTQKQITLDAKPEIYIQDGNYLLDIDFKYKIFPNSFWGLGNDTPQDAEERYNMKSFEIQTAYLKRLPPYMNFGIEYIFQSHEVTEVVENGLLAAEDIVGNTSIRNSGFGFVFNLDNRNSNIVPQSGYFLEYNAQFYNESFGADTNFYKYYFDLRKYFSLNKKSVIALQLYTELSFGTVPFQLKAWYGGAERGRGYFRGRFIDNHMILTQAEYRFRFLPRWEVTAFGTAGEVAALPSDFISDLKGSLGGGLRFQVNKKSPTLIRLDIGFGQEGNQGFYIGVNEVF
ncbi:BamA/TamA family outer membrane protein [Algivirga pacifica]|uniref:BamA/TamA family outer membrane protein n=1 Tax=Algivirga pacifica TaxID=1162670 RepID=A0ABP9DBL5_9BACT